MPVELRIGTRGSQLALAQSQWVKQKLESRYAESRVELVTIKTTGDKIVDSPLSKIGGKGLFVKEIEQALLDSRIDLAVHSMKDMPAELPAGLRLCAFPEREDPRDAMISTGSDDIENFPRGARVGTGSLRRGAQLLHLRPDLKIEPIRGNVDTRLRKLETENLQAVILAAAGLMRLGLGQRITQRIPPGKILPAVGQGCLGIEVRSADETTINRVAFLNHQPTEITVRAERAFLQKLQGGCQVPIAGFARLEGQELHLQGMVAELDGSRLIKDSIAGPISQGPELGAALAGKLLDAGAAEILARIYENG